LVNDGYDDPNETRSFMKNYKDPNDKTLEFNLVTKHKYR